MYHYFAILFWGGETCLPGGETYPGLPPPPPPPPPDKTLKPFMRTLPLRNVLPTGCHKFNYMYVQHNVVVGAVNPIAL